MTALLRIGRATCAGFAMGACTHGDPWWVPFVATLALIIFVDCSIALAKRA